MITLAIVQTASRVTLGSFFAASGGHKLFDPETREKIRAFFTKLGVRRFVVLVAGGEFLGGLGLGLGILTPLAAAGLALILIGAIYLDVWETDIKGKHPKDPADWWAKIMDCPEVLMLGLLAIILALGAGPWSVDHLWGLA